MSPGVPQQILHYNCIKMTRYIIYSVLKIKILTPIEYIRYYMFNIILNT